MMTQTAYSKAQQAKAQAAQSRHWAHGYRHSDGLQFVLFASEHNADVVYQTHINGLGCSCPRGQRNQSCWHCLAAQIKTDQARRPSTYDRLFPSDLEDAF